MKKREYRIDAAEKVELYKAFYQKMVQEGFSAEFIGEELAAISLALYTGLEE